MTRRNKMTRTDKAIIAWLALLAVWAGDTSDTVGVWLAVVGLFTVVSLTGSMIADVLDWVVEKREARYWEKEQAAVAEESERLG